MLFSRTSAHSPTGTALPHARMCTCSRPLVLSLACIHARHTYGSLVCPVSSEGSSSFSDATEPVAQRPSILHATRSFFTKRSRLSSCSICIISSGGVDGVMLVCCAFHSILAARGNQGGGCCCSCMFACICCIRRFSCTCCCIIMSSGVICGGGPGGSGALWGYSH